jgi:6-phosphogluconolactonase
MIEIDWKGRPDEGRLEAFETVEALALSASARIVNHIGGAFRRKQRAALALAGGRTPFAIYDQLCKWPLRWDWVDIIPTSERWVSRYSLERNGTLIRAKLLKERAADANYIPLIEPWEEDPGHKALMWATARADETVKALGRLDLVLLGMGVDGHVASIFQSNPASEALLDLDGDRSCLLTPPRPEGPLQPRISLSLATICNARHVMVVIRGDRKLLALRDALEDPGQGSPIAAVLNQRSAPVEILWSP